MGQIGQEQDSSSALPAFPLVVPLQAATAATEAMEAAYVALMRAALDAHWADAAGSGAGGAAPLPNDRLALNMALSLLYTCCTRVGARMARS